MISAAGVNLGERIVGAGAPCFVIAEAGVNHNGDLGMAMELVDAAIASGADAVKFQTFRADRLASPDAPLADYQRRSRAGAQREMLAALELSRNAHLTLQERCGRRIMFLSSPFDFESVDLLESIGVPAFKVPSGELTNGPLLARIAERRRPMILSTGMASLDEVASAVAVVRNHGNPPLVLLHCVSAYPADPATVNLNAMNTLSEVFRVPVGFSDHTMGIAIPIAAAALGASVIEKHLTLDRSLDGPDHAASIEPAEFAEMVGAIRTVQQALGNGLKRPTPAETEIASVARKSLVAAEDIGIGTVVTDSLVIEQRPGTGLPPAMRAEIVGRVATRPIRKGSLFSIDMVAERTFD